MQRELRELRDRLERFEAHAGRRLSAIEENVQQTDERLTGRIEAIEERQSALRRSALRQDVWAGRLFVIGAVLSVIANLV